MHFYNLPISAKHTLDPCCTYAMLGRNGTSGNQVQLPAVLFSRNAGISCGMYSCAREGRAHCVFVTLHKQHFQLSKAFGYLNVLGIPQVIQINVIA